MQPNAKLHSRRAMSGIGAYALLVGASLRSRLAYKRSFLLEACGRALLTSLELMAIFFIFNHVEAIAGWTKWEVVYLFGAGNFALGVAEVITSGLNHMDRMVRDGELDRLLVRPAGTLTQLLAFECEFFHLGRAAQGLAVILLAIFAGGLELDALDLLALSGSLACGIGVFASLFIASGATCYWTLESGEAFNAFTYGGVQMVQFPLSVYPRAIALLFVWAVPVGLTLYYPALAVFGKTDPLGLPSWIAWCAPLGSLVTLAASLKLWAIGLRRYQSTGS